MMTPRGTLGAISPFIPVLFGIILKFSLFDKPPDDLSTHLKTTYRTGIWIDFIVTAYVAGLAWLLSRRRHEGRLAVILFVVPLVCFVICVLLTLGLTKAGVKNELLTLYLPAVIAAVSVALAGNALAAAE